MNKVKINSLKELHERKIQIKCSLTDFEEQIQYDFDKLIHPFSFLKQKLDYASYFDNCRTANNVKRMRSIIKIGAILFGIYKIYKKGSF